MSSSSPQKTSLVFIARQEDGKPDFTVVVPICLLSSLCCCPWQGKWCAQKGQAGSCLPPCCDDKTLVARKGNHGDLLFHSSWSGQVSRSADHKARWSAARRPPLVDGEKPIYLFRLQSRPPLWAGLRRGNSSSNILQCVVQYSGGWTGTGLFFCCCCVRCTITSSFAHSMNRVIVIICLSSTHVL